ncbi:MAG: prevent-host-death family protein [bacterium]
MLDNYQIISEDGQPRFAVIDYSELMDVRLLLDDPEKLEDYLDFMLIQRIKSECNEYVSIEEIEKLV